MTELYFPDNPPAPDDSPFRAFGIAQEMAYNMDQPEMHDVLREFRKITDRYTGDQVIIGEMALRPVIGLRSVTATGAGAVGFRHLWTHYQEA